MDGAEVAAAVPAAVGLGDLPEFYAAQVLLRPHPPEIRRLARLNHAFCGAAWARYVFSLPENYNNLMEFVGSGDGNRRRRQQAGKKEIYARLARPVPFGDAQKTVGILVGQEQRHDLYGTVGQSTGHNWYW